MTSTWVIRLPEELKSRGTLKDSEAETFKDAADDFMGSLGSKVKSKISAFISNVERNAPTTISDAFVDEIQRKISVLKDQVNNAAQTIDRLERLTQDRRGCTVINLIVSMSKRYPTLESISRFWQFKRKKMAAELQAHLIDAQSQLDGTAQRQPRADCTVCRTK